MLIRFIVRVIFAALGLALAAHFVPGVSYADLTTLLIAALVLGVVNAFLRPILVVLTLPLTIVTLGLWLLLLNAAMVGLVAYFVKGFEVTGVVPALLAAVATGVTSWIGHVVIGDARRDRD